MVQKYWLSILFSVLMFGGLSVACAEIAPEQRQEDPYSGQQKDAYVPLFVMYSGSASPQKMQVLRQFLASNEISGEVIRDTLETVAYKMGAFKTGFAYPVFRDETSTSGHTCVVADNRHADPREALSLVVSERVRRPLLLERSEQLESQALLDNVFAHELFHCYDLVRHSLVHVGQQVVDKGSSYFAYWGEVGADAYASLQHIQRGGDKALLRAVRDFRTLNLLNGDAVHYTNVTIGYVIEHYNAQRLSGMSTRELIALADRIREETALDVGEFAKLEAASSRLNREYERLIAGYAGLDKAYEGELMRPRDGAVSPEYVGAVYAQVHAALWRIGGSKSVGSAYFSPLGEQFDLARTRTRVARLD